MLSTSELPAQGCPTDEAIDDAAGHSRLTAMAYQAVLAGYSDYDFDFGALPPQYRKPPPSPAALTL